MALGKAIDSATNSISHSSISTMKAKGVSVALLYFGIGGDWKRGTHHECDDLRAAGISPAAVAESTAGWMVGGYTAGVVAAKKTRDDVVACGGPSNPFVWAACDTDTSSTASVIQCVRGMRDVLGQGKVGIYGSAKVCLAVHNALPDVKMWEAQSTGWSGFISRSLAGSRGFSLFQLMGQPYGSLGVDYDGNDMLQADVGQWDFHKSAIGNPYLEVVAGEEPLYHSKLKLKSDCTPKAQPSHHSQSLTGPDAWGHAGIISRTSAKTLSEGEYWIQGSSGGVTGWVLYDNTIYCDDKGHTA